MKPKIQLGRRFTRHIIHSQSKFYHTYAMKKKLLKRYELLLYFCIGLLAAILFFLGSYVITTGVINGIILNLCSELLGVAIIFFIVNRMFGIDDEQDELNKDEFYKDFERILQDKLYEDLEIMRESLTNINQDITDLTKKITSEIDKKQELLLEILSKKFSEETHKSHENLRKAIEDELQRSFRQPINQSQTVDRLLELTIHSIETMGSFQRSAIEADSRRIFADMLDKIGKPAENLSTEVKILQQQVQDVQKHINLPVLHKNKSLDTS